MKNRYLYFLLSLLLILVYWSWFIPGPRVAIDYPFISKSFLEYYFSVPFVWTEAGAEGLGQYSTFFLWGWPLSFLISIGALVGFSFAFLERIIYLLPILILGVIGIWKVGREFRLSNLSCFISCFFYLSNTYILLLIDGGQLSIALAYAWFPMCFLLLKKSTKNGIKNKILSGLAIAILGFFDIRFIYILGLLGLMLFLYQLLLIEKKNLISFFITWIKTILSLTFIFLGLHFYWLYPFLMVPISSSMYQYFIQTSFTNFVNSGHSLLALAPHWYINVFGKITSLKFEFIFIPILVFLAPLLRIRNRETGFWLIIAVSSVFLSKGSGEPFPQLYMWLFNYVPGFSLFRDPTKFFFLVMFSYSILIGISVDEIVKRLGTNTKKGYLFVALIVFYLLFLIRPVIFGEMTGTLSIPPLQKEYSSLARLLDSDKTFGRVFWIPHFPDLGYADSIHPRVEAAIAVQKRTFGVGTVGTYETFNFLRESPYMGEIFDIAGIEYIAYPPLNPKRDDMHPENVRYYSLFSDQLAKRPWLSQVSSSLIPLYKVKNHQDKFFITPNVWWVIGSDSLLNEATKSANLKLAKNALIFTEEHQGLGQRIDELPQAKIVLNDKTSVDLAASFINPADLIFPASQLSFNPDKSGWWKRGVGDLISWRNFLQTKYGIDNQDFDLGGGWAVSEKELKLKVESEKFKQGKILLTRVMESSRSGQVSFYQNGELIGRVETKKALTNMRWFEIGQLSLNNSNIKMETLGDINIVNALASIDKAEWMNYQDKSQNLQDRIVNFDEEVLSNDTVPQISYQKINPSKYLVNVSNLTSSSFLIFSEAYDSFWKIEGKSALPVYALLDGFRIDRNGQYVVEFEAQKYVYPGLIVSGLSLLIVSFLLIRSSKRP